MAFATTEFTFALLFFAIFLFISPSYEVQSGVDYPEMLPGRFHYRYFLLKKNRRLFRDNTTTIQVYNDLACLHQCTRMEKTCFSANFKKKPLTNGLHLCELLNNHWNELSDALEEDEEFDHMFLKLDTYSSCAEVPSKTNGIFSIAPSASSHKIQVYCDMETSGGGWAVIQKRIDGSVDFYRNWDDYKRGFGNKLGEFWLGLDNIHAMTSQRPHRLRFDMEDFEGNTRYAEYSSIQVSDEADNYRLTIGQYSGTAGDSLTSFHNGMQFSTKDRDNDLDDTKPCAVTYTGAWWYGQCHQANPNGQYLNGANTLPAQGINWKTWLDYSYSLKRMEIKIKPV